MKPRKPKSIARGPLKAHARKPPTDSDPRWYWQVIYYEDRAQRSARYEGKSAHRRGTPSEIRAHLDAVLAGDWKQPAVVSRELPEVLTVDGLFRLWLRAQKDRRDRGRIKPGTYYNKHEFYRLNIKGSPVESVPLDRLSRRLLQEWVHGLEDDGYASRTIRVRWGLFRAALRWGHGQGLTPPRLPAAPELPRVDAYTSNRHTPTRADIEATIAALDGWRAVAVSLLLATGARVSEVTELRWMAWSRTDRRLTLTGKTGARTIPTNTAAHQALTDWWMRSGQPADGRLFDRANASKSIQRALSPFGYTPHAIRRRVSSILIEGGIDPKAYEAYMGHSFREGLKTYAQARPERVQAAADLLGK